MRRGLSRSAGRHVTIVHFQHENRHCSSIDIGVSVVVRSVGPMTVGFLSTAYDLLKVLVPCSPVFRSAAHASCLKAGLGVVVPFVNVYSLPLSSLVGDDPLETFLGFLRFGVFPNLKT